MALVASACGGEGEAPAAALGAGTGEGVVFAAPDGQTLVFDDGLEARLADITAPRPREGRARAEPGFEEARAGLEDLARGRRLRLEPDPRTAARDRWGRLATHAWTRGGDGVWLQGALVAAGLVRVAPERDGDAEAARALLRLEAEARAAGLGLWAEPYYAVRVPEAVSPAIGSFQIVEGVVVDAAEVRGIVYLNFGPDWRSDFTASVGREDADAFDVDALIALSGARVRVRGMVYQRNGPMIDLYAPAQLEGPLDAGD